MTTSSGIQAFIRCPHCAMPHPADVALCPVADKPIEPEDHRTIPAPPPDGAIEMSTSSDDLLRLTPRFLDGYVLDGKYRVEELLGSGAMGLIYEGTHLALQRKVVIKVIGRRHRPGSEAEKRFYREAQISSSIGHPNIINVHDLGTLEDGCPYLVMERLAGESLAARISRQGPLPMDRALEIAAHLLSALDATHRQGVVHRDIKPENVFLARVTGGGEQVKLLDFGVSRGPEEHDALLDRPDTIVGTPHYLSPEQACASEIDHRVDIWALGVTMYEMLTGRLPFESQGGVTELLLQILREQPPPPSHFRSEIPPPLDSVVMTAMAKDRDQRYQSAAEMLEAIAFAAAYLRGQEPPAEDPTDVSGNYSNLRLVLPDAKD